MSGHITFDMLKKCPWKPTLECIRKGPTECGPQCEHWKETKEEKKK